MEILQATSAISWRRQEILPLGCGQLRRFGSSHCYAAINEGFDYEYGTNCEVVEVISHDNDGGRNGFDSRSVFKLFRDAGRRLH